MRKPLRAAALLALAATCLGARADDWRGSMLALSATLSRLIPAIASQEAPDGAQQAELLAFSRDLSRMAHEVSGSKKTPNADPALRFVSREFRKDMAEATRALERGDWAAGRERLRATTRYCLGCHSLHASSRNDAPAFRLPGRPGSYSELERAEFYAATRQFALAIIHFENALKDPRWAREHPAQWNDAVQKLLAIVVRVRGNPSLTLEMISRFFDTASYPRELAHAARLWRGQAKAWRLERRAEGREPSADRRLARAASLLEQAEALLRSQGPHSGFILYLRASSILHDLMAAPPRGVPMERILYLAGLASEGMAQTNFWTLPVDFFRACVRVSPDPRGEWAARCRARIPTEAS
jgi:hypothetical protein